VKRSEINKIMTDAVEFIKNMNFVLPPFVLWSPDDWSDKGNEYDELRRNMLGWDITDFGSGDYSKIGLLMITLRNGNMYNLNYIKPYAEKLLIVEDSQITPYHFHFKKMEDIINRGGGNLMVKLYNSGADYSFADTPVTVSMDGRNFKVPAGSVIKVKPGESITFPCGLYHKFWSEAGSGKIMVTEVSKVNDDRVDNHFYEETGRFPAIEEDEAPRYLLSMDYKEFATLG
jgi:ABC-type sugar transport system, auxiliary component